MQDSTTYQYVLDQGRIEARREMLLGVGGERFGPPTEAEGATVAGIADLDRLKRLARRLERVGSWQELLRTR